MNEEAEFQLASHLVSRIEFGSITRLEKGELTVAREELRALLLEDAALAAVDLEIARPGESCRAAPVFDIVEPRAKEPGGSPDFPGVLGPPHPAGIGVAHRLAGAAVSVLRERSPGGSRGATGYVLEMGGEPGQVSPYGALSHLVVMPRTRAELPAHAIEKAYRMAGLRAAVYLARAALGRTPDSTRRFEPVGPALHRRPGLPRVAYVGQIYSRQRKPQLDEHILYGANTEGMLPVLLRPAEWLDGAVLPSYHTSLGGAETYFYQNHPVILELYRRHDAGELEFVGTVATIAGADNFDRERNCRAAAGLVRWALAADAAVLTKYGGGVPHADMAETARLLERMGVRTAVMASDVARDRRVESALLFNFPEVDAIVYNGGNDTRWRLPRAERVLASTREMADILAGPLEIEALNVVGVANQQGASRLRAMVY